MHNKHGSGKTWHKKGRKNYIIKTLNRESVNVMGFQSENGFSVLSFPKRGNRATFSLHLLEIRIANMENSEVREKLIEMLNSNEVNEEIIEEELKKNLLTTEELKEQIHKATEIPADSQSVLEKRMNRIFGKVKVKAKQIVDIQENELNLLLDENMELKEELSEERRIVVVLDNYSAHLAHIVKRIAKFLKIKLIFLPTHSPKLNPIEQVWRAMKKKISSIDFKCLKELSKKIKFYYFKYIKNKTFTDKWMEKFIIKR
ncbi:transposase [Methanobrevibacter curvatus]|uniref:DDE superfamily endonuclease n=1 Tax=Methanobrevibacter curvatus TaxID=49547 RepID=A0A166C4T5_9EURY|nr:transposase [Methanobrevibacter curvatus]KZX14128.1 DDE superfamily endonuclease [Methanobrevibacter curvatus]